MLVVVDVQILHYPSRWSKIYLLTHQVSHGSKHKFVPFRPVSWCTLRSANRYQMDRLPKLSVTAGILDLSKELRTSHMRSAASYGNAMG